MQLVTHVLIVSCVTRAIFKRKAPSSEMNDRSETPKIGSVDGSDFVSIKFFAVQNRQRPRLRMRV